MLSLVMFNAELASGVSSASQDRRDSRGSRGESDDDSTDLDDENYPEEVRLPTDFVLIDLYYRLY